MKGASMVGLHPAFRIAVAGNRPPKGRMKMLPLCRVAVDRNKVPALGVGRCLEAIVPQSSRDIHHVRDQIVEEIGRKGDDGAAVVGAVEGEAGGHAA